MLNVPSAPSSPGDSLDARIHGSVTTAGLPSTSVSQARHPLGVATAPVFELSGRSITAILPPSMAIGAVVTWRSLIGSASTVTSALAHSGREPADGVVRKANR